MDTVEDTAEVKTDALAHWDSVITEDIDFSVERKGIHTYGGDDSINMPDHSATIRVNPDGSRAPLWVVGSRYEVVDHREVIKQFAEVIDRADLEAEIKHSVYQNGCRIYSTFTLDKVYNVGGKSVRPFLTLTTSHDGSLRVGFLMGAVVDGRTLNISKTVYGAHAKHTKGINIEKTLKAIVTALKSFTDEVLPMWARMQDTVLDRDDARKIIDAAIKKGVITKLRASEVEFTADTNVWEVYTSLVDQVSVVRGKRGTAERAFYRNVDVSEYFNKLSSTEAMTAIEDIIDRD